MDNEKIIGEKDIMIHVFNFVIMFLSSMSFIIGLFIVSCCNSDIIINKNKKEIMQKGGDIEKFDNKIAKTNLLGLLFLIIGTSLFIARILD